MLLHIEKVLNGEDADPRALSALRSMINCYYFILHTLTQLYIIYIFVLVYLFIYLFVSKAYIFSPPYLKDSMYSLLTMLVIW